MRFSTILGIESSCDDTAAAVWEKGKILANVVAGQKVHEAWGGVVPELASRAHQENIVPVVHQALAIAGKSLNEIHAIAYTRGPGLMGSLLVGANFAKGLSLGLDIPLIGVHHLQAHVAALFIENPAPPLPLLCLLVSGGHTQLVWVTENLQTRILGSTLDDAAGEAFDKAAKLLGLPYPGGPVIDRLASQGNPHAFQFPDSRVPGLDMSFSGIKTSLLYFLRDRSAGQADFVKTHLNDICASYQHAVVRYLLKKTESAIRDLKPASIGLAGGVSANSALRSGILDTGQKHQIPVLIPSFEYCTDNAAMIAAAGHYLLESGISGTLSEVPFVRG